MIFAKLAERYGFKPWEIGEMTDDQIDGYMKHITAYPTVEARMVEWER